MILASWPGKGASYHMTSEVQGYSATSMWRVPSPYTQNKLPNRLGAHSVHARGRSGGESQQSVMGWRLRINELNDFLWERERRWTFPAILSPASNGEPFGCHSCKINLAVFAELRRLYRGKDAVALMLYVCGRSLRILAPMRPLGTRRSVWLAMSTTDLVVCAFAL